MHGQKGKSTFGTFLSIRSKVHINPYIFQGYDCDMQVNLVIGYCKYRSAGRVRIIDMYALKNLMVIVCCISLLIFILGIFANTSLAQGTGFQDYNTTLETTSNGSPNGAHKIVASDIINSSIRNEYNRTNGYFVTVLPARSDDSIYSGVITFTASEPVRVEILHAPSLSNYKINSNQLGLLSVYFNNKSIPATLILPNYSGGYFSFSIPFTGKALELSYEKPFIAIYTVSAEIMNLKATGSNETMLSQQVPGAYFKAGVGNMLIEAIPYLPVDTLQELPFSDLSISDLSMIIGKVPLDRAEVILNKIPAEKQQEILNSIPTERRQELGK
jgi:hypothetical protein